MRLKKYRKKKSIVNVHDYKVLEYCIKKGTVAGCGYCESIFDENDLDYAFKEWKCQYCHSTLMKILMK